MTDCLKIVPSALFITDVSVDACVSSCACQILSFSEWNMFPIRVLVALSQSEINNEDTVLGGVVASDKEVVWLDVSVNNSLFVNFLDTHYLRGI